MPGTNPQCFDATAITATTATISGSADDVDPGQFVEVVWGPALGTYPNTAASAAGDNTTGQTVSGNLTGLTPGTTYHYVAQVRTPAGGGSTGSTLISAECTFTTDPALANTPGTTPAVCAPAEGGGGPDVEQQVLCDVDADGNVVGLAMYVYTYEDGAPTGAPTLVNPATNAPYTVQGTLQQCGDATDVEVVELCDVQADESSVQFLRHFVYNDSSLVDSFDTTLAGAVYVPTGVSQEDCDAHAVCSPDPNIDANGDCGPGEAPDFDTITDDGVAPDSVVQTDAAADALCGGTWDNPATPQNAPFPIEESFRNATYDEPGPVIQGSSGGPGPGPANGNYFGLTADPANQGLGNPAVPADAAGEGWGRGSDINSFSNGFWQIPTTFPTSGGMTAEITFASHDGTNPGGDGWVFGFTNGGVPAQTSVVGGGGSLGLGLWQGGYVGIVLDEFGGTGAGANTISIQGLGTFAPNIIANASVAPNAINQTTRAQPLRLRTSIIEQGGTTFVSASIDWNDGAGFVQYFNRVPVSGVLGAAPATLRMGTNASSGGAFRSAKEQRDASAQQGGIQTWRAFPFTHDPIPACATGVNLSASVDVTFTSDSQDIGNGNPEAYLWLVNTVTGAIVDRQQVSSVPARVGQRNALSVNVDNIPPGDIANYRVYVGSESRDSNGAYSTLWENADFDVTAVGCPPTPVRTLAISAPCPIPVTIVGGDAGEGGGGGGTTVVNTPSTFEDAVVCATVGGAQQQVFRREVRNADGNVEVTFLGADGLAVTPTAWTPGPCVEEDADRERICYTLTSTGDDVQVGWARHDDSIPNTPQTPNGIAFFTGTGAPIDPTADGFTQVVCDDEESLVLGDVCVVSDAFPGQTLPAVAVQDPDGTMEFLNASTGQPWPGNVTVVVCPPEPDRHTEILCDDDGPFLRTYNRTVLGLVHVYDTDFEDALYTPVGTVRRCDVQSADDPTEYATTVVDVTGGTPQTFTPNGDEVAWTARNRNATTATIQVNGGQVLPMDTAENIGASLSGHDVNDVLDDTVVIDPGDGAVRFTITRRLP